MPTEPVASGPRPLAGHGGDAREASGRGPDAAAWHRVHPVTPLVRGWMIVVVVGLGILRTVAESLPNGTANAEAVGRAWPQISIGVLVFAVIVAVYCVLAWRMTTYTVDDESVRVHSGILFRRQRRTRLDRLQAVDLVRPLLARAFALAELRLEVAGGDDSAVKLGFLKLDDANRLRNELLARAAGLKVDRSQAVGVTLEAPSPSPGVLGAPQAPEQPVTAVPTGRLVGSLALSGVTVATVVFVVCVAISTIATGTFDFLIAAIPVALGIGSFVFSRFSGDFGFRSAISPDGIRLHRGLFETRSQTIPPGRVQAIVLTQGLLWRRTGWWRVQMNVAGYAAGDGTLSANVLLPVGSVDEAVTAVWLVLPDLGVDDPRALLDSGMAARSVGVGFVGLPRRARWLDPIAWRRTGVAITDRALLIRRGRITRRLQIVPHERTQSLGLRQGPLQRRLKVATFALHSTPGPVLPQAPHVDLATAAELLNEQAERARTARANAGPELWMRRGEVPS